ncbi:hypothetical protein [Amycolatopsis keratiniphila]|uniref:Uncharacterized protein n=1 Tax=Amycolatopsis keratiniphila subsp. keratiniphila TaxID=227715 RepID=A0A1W2LGF9_9PSEU|nr:hypothetical protein [Amycolatopsis keratiniphila]ONF61893.1 hypothetical protein AVR91_0241210 [Amycolatopsis keratiniphila subsp. keratiniphila]
MTDNSPSSSPADSAGAHAFVRAVTRSRPADGVVGPPWLRRAAHRVQDDPGTFLAWLEAILGDEEAVREAAKRSYWHPNGFAKMVLHSSADFRIRLHVWPASTEPSRGESNPHSHRWEFASTVVAGEGMHMVEYGETDEGGELHTRYWYGADPADPAALRRDGQARLRKLRAPHVRRGQVYSCDTEVVHTVRPIEAGLTATLVFQGPHRSAKTVVYCLPGQTDDQPNGEMSEEEFSLLVESVVAAFTERVSS